MMLQYIRNRLVEKSTWASIGAAVVAGAALAVPYSYLIIGAGVIGVLVPSPGVKGQDN